MAYKTPEFDQFVEDLMREGHVPGLAFAVVDGEKTYAKVSKLIT
jgi:CubicO group peptidase (beta-lactamase class C family)